MDYEDSELFPISEITGHRRRNQNRVLPYLTVIIDIANRWWYTGP
jgi:hypothetical protein